MTRDGGHTGDSQWAAAALGVPVGASNDEVDAAFRQAVLRHHPDAGGDPDRFRELADARQALRQGPPPGRAGNVVFVAKRRPRWWTAFTRWLSGRPRPPARQLS